MLLSPHFLADFVPDSLTVKYYVVRALNICGVALTLRSPKARTLRIQTGESATNNKYAATTGRLCSLETPLTK